MQLLRPGFGPFGEHDARAARQRVDIAAAMSLHGNCCLSASPGSCQIATLRRIMRDWRGADRRPSDGKIKARTAVVLIVVVGVGVTGASREFACWRFFRYA